MARGVNKVILIGNLGNDPETRYLPNGAAVTNVNIATSQQWKDRETGQANERTEWHRVVFFRRLAEIAGEYLKKGSKVYIEGSLRTRQWEREGQKHYTTEIVAAELEMLDSRGDNAGAGSSDASASGSSNNNSNRDNRYSGGKQASAGNTSEPDLNAPPPEDFDDDIPF
jgi:single-strand DNA-binding protein